MRPIPVFATVGEAVRFALDNLRLLAVAGAVPVVLYVAVMLALADGSGGTDEAPGWLNLLEALAEILLVPLLVVWHRAALFGAAGADGGWVPRLDARTWRYAAVSAALVVFSALMLIVWSGMESWDQGPDAGTALPALYLGFVIAVTFAGLIWLNIRLAFLLVEFAVGRGGSLVAQFRLTLDRFRPLFFIGALIFAPLLGVQIAAMELFADFGEDHEGRVLVDAAATILGSVLWVAASTIAYRHAIGEHSDTTRTEFAGRNGNR